jgi:hypothetical protein
MNDKAYHIIERFPDKSHTLELLMTKDPEFLSMCEDYDACFNALQYWTDSKEAEAKTRVHEYRTLIEELEEEITAVLAALEPGGMD